MVGLLRFGQVHRVEAKPMSSGPNCPFLEPLTLTDRLRVISEARPAPSSHTSISGSVSRLGRQLCEERSSGESWNGDRSFLVLLLVGCVTLVSLISPTQL